MYGNIEDEEEGSDESSGEDNTTSDEGVVKSKGKSIDRINSDLNDGDESNDDSDNEEGEQGEEEEEDEEDEEEDESYIEIDTEEVFEHIAKGKSYATFEGTLIQFTTVQCGIFFLNCTAHVVRCNILYCHEGHGGGPHLN